MDDLISRQSALDAMDSVLALASETVVIAENPVCVGVQYARDAIERLPSAQPEIIRCKDCKHQVKEWRTDKRLKDGGYTVCGCDVVGDSCGYWALFGRDDDYCSMAERRTDGSD